jgi:hypothetical protein
MKNLKQIATVITIYLFVIISCKNENSRTTIKKIPTINSRKVELVKEIKLIENKDNIIGQVLGIQVDNNGNLYILDRAQASVLKYTKKGEAISKIGKSGSGPGEFKNTQQLILRNNLLGVFDQQFKKISIFDTSGVFQNEVELSYLENYMAQPGYFDFTQDENILTGVIEHIGLNREETFNKSKVLCEVNREKGSVLKAFGSFPGSALEFANDKMITLSKVRQDNKGNNYFAQIDIPIIRKYDPEDKHVADLSYRSESYNLEHGNQIGKNGVSPDKSRLGDFFIGEKTGYVYITHWNFHVKWATPKITSYLVVLDSKGDPIVTDFEIPDFRFCLDKEENIYVFNNMEPDNNIIGIYKIN